MSPPRPTHFFKYYTANVAKIVLQTQKMRWNCPLNFNDPFDCYFSYEARLDPVTFREKLADRLADLFFGDDEPHFDTRNPYGAIFSSLKRSGLRLALSREEFKAKTLPSIDKGIENAEALRRKVREEWERQMQDLRLFCVCEINDNLLLWSHYTDNHAGVAFQLECIEELDVPLLIAEPVIYSDEAPGIATEQEWMDSLLGLRPFNSIENVWKRLVTSKARVWEHEREWRVVTARNAYGNERLEDLSFSPREVSRAFLGCRISNEDKKDILDLLSGPFSHVEVYQASQNPRMYKLDFQRVK